MNVSSASSSEQDSIMSVKTSFTSTSITAEINSYKQLAGQSNFEIGANWENFRNALAS